MKTHRATPFRMVLPLPRFVLHPLTAVVVAAMQVDTPMIQTSNPTKR